MFLSFRIAANKKNTTQTLDRKQIEGCSCLGRLLDASPEALPTSSNGVEARRSTSIDESRSGAIGAVGSALPSHGRGHRFESGIAHHVLPPHDEAPVSGASFVLQTTWLSRTWQGPPTVLRRRPGVQPDIAGPAAAPVWFPLGEAFAAVTNRDFGDCDDTERCAGPSSTFQVVA
jgi:hypothetical protein